MGEAEAVLCDTNILVRMGEPSDAEHHMVLHAVDTLLAQGQVLYYTLQNIAELWNVCTRPASRNGLGLSIRQAKRRVEDVEALLVHLPDVLGQYGLWRELVERYEVRGVQVHDARLVATMQAHGLRRILTLNGTDFRRFEGIEVVEPGAGSLGRR